MNTHRYPGYDVLDKQHTLSWDDVTRRTVNQRLVPPPAPRALASAAWQTLCAVCDRIVPQHGHPQTVPLAALIDARLHANAGDGYRDARLPPLREAWRVGLAALDEESRAAHDMPYATLDASRQDALLAQMQRGELRHPAWQNMPCRVFFVHRVVKDICAAYYAHPHAWSEIGFGGPANPRGYVRMYFDRRDPWEAVEARPGREMSARKGNRHAR